jgi:hypothetical protein
MKPEKIFKSLAELSTDSIDARDAEPEKTTPEPLEMLANAAPGKIPADSLSRVPGVQGFYNWGINE